MSALALLFPRPGEKVQWQALSWPHIAWSWYFPDETYGNLPSGKGTVWKKLLSVIEPQPNCGGITE
jgi:hypothetical protein